MVYVFPLEVWPYARTVQLKPSKKRVTSGWAVVVNIEYCVAFGSWTWSKLKICFFGGAAVTPGVPWVGGPLVASTWTWLFPPACMTARWNRWGIEFESCVVVGRIRTAANHGTEDEQLHPEGRQL